MIKEDGSKAGFFDQALYQIMQLRYPDLNIRVDSTMRYFQNWNAFGKEAKKAAKADKERFETMFGISEINICPYRPRWSKETFVKHFGKDLVFVHFNGDAKFPLMQKCMTVLMAGHRRGLWISPDMEIVVNVAPDRGAMMKWAHTPGGCDSADRCKGYCDKLGQLLAKREEAMAKAWYTRHPFAYRKEPCACPKSPCVMECTPDETADPSGAGAVAYTYRTPEEIARSG